MSEAVRTDTSLAALSGLPWPESCLDVNSEDAFHGAFIQFCAEKRETDPQRLLARFIRYHDRITDFITVLDDSKAQLGPRSLHSYFWPKAFEGVLVSIPLFAIRPL